MKPSWSTWIAHRESERTRCGSIYLGFSGRDNANVAFRFARNVGEERRSADEGVVNVELHRLKPDLPFRCKLYAHSEMIGSAACLGNVPVPHASLEKEDGIRRRIML